MILRSKLWIYSAGHVRGIEVGIDAEQADAVESGIVVTSLTSFNFQLNTNGFGAVRTEF